MPRSFQPKFPQSRRRFLSNSVLAVSSMLLPTVGCAKQSAESETRLPILVVGAGIAGLAAAQKLQGTGFKVVVLEARDRVGGRIWTDRSLGVPLDLGAAWIHGINGNPIAPLAQEIGAKTFVTDDDSVIVFDSTGKPITDRALEGGERKYENLREAIADLAEDLDNDLSIAEAIRRIKPNALKDLLMQYLLSAYLEFDTGGAIEKLSTLNWDSDEAFPGQDALFPQGYDAVVNFLARGLEIQTNRVVQAIAYDDDKVTITTNQGTFTGQCAIITLPLGVLKKGSVSFSPPLPQAMSRAIATVGMGTVNKVVLLFQNAFWDPEVQYFGFTSPVKGKYPYFLNTRTFSSTNALIAFGLGNYAIAMEGQPNAKIQADVMDVLKILFGARVQSPQKILVSRWSADPFAGGAYSYSSIGTTQNDFNAMGQPIANKLFFAGEHTSTNYRGTVHGAYLTGLREAARILSAIGDR
jgi:monoamine oxidase